MQDKITGLFIEPTNICTLKCPGCARTRFIGQWPQHWKNNSVDIDDLHRFIDIDLTDKHVTLSGNLGDPIYHPEFHRLVGSFKQKGCRITIITNGSYKSETWWKELVQLLDNKDWVVFSIDGLPNNFTQYRINGDWDSTETAIKICVQSQCRTQWKYIPFSFNEDCINQARSLSNQLGMDDFFIDPSDRFDTVTEKYKPSGNYFGPKYQQKIVWVTESNNITVDPKCANGDQHFISADGHYAPCCPASDFRFYYKHEFGKNRDNYHITKTTLSELLAMNSVKDFYSTLNQHPMCQYNCPKTQS